MKNKFITAILLIAITVFVTSCASPKYGCPANPMGTAAKVKSTNS